MRTRSFLAFPLFAFLAGCVSDQLPMTWVRTDGQRIGGNAALEQKIEIDKTICKGEAQKAGLAGQQQIYGGLTTQLVAARIKDDSMVDVAKGCMAEHGYVYVAEADAQAKLEAFAATAAPPIKTRTASR